MMDQPICSLCFLLLFLVLFLVRSNSVVNKFSPKNNKFAAFRGNVLYFECYCYCNAFLISVFSVKLADTAFASAFNSL